MSEDIYSIIDNSYDWAESRMHHHLRCLTTAHQLRPELILERVSGAFSLSLSILLTVCHHHTLLSDLGEARHGFASACTLRMALEPRLMSFQAPKQISRPEPLFRPQPLASPGLESQRRFQCKDIESAHDYPATICAMEPHDYSTSISSLDKGHV